MKQKIKNEASWVTDLFSQDIHVEEEPNEESLAVLVCDDSLAGGVSQTGLTEGGKGSGNFGHKGTPGHEGGSKAGTGGGGTLSKYVKQTKDSVDLEKYADELRGVFSNWKQENAEKMVFFTKDGKMIVIGSGDKGYVNVSLASIQKILIDNGTNFYKLKYIVHNHNQGEDFSKGDTDLHKYLRKYGFTGDFQAYTPKSGQIRTQEKPEETGGKESLSLTQKVKRIREVLKKGQ